MKHTSDPAGEGSSSPARQNRRSSELVRGRVSAPGSTYFLTLCERHRQPGLTFGVIANAILEALLLLHRTGDFTVTALTIMPDHLHLLGTLGERIALHRFVGRLKSQTRPVLKQFFCAWQNGFYEHRLRPGDDLERIARYVFLNPYKARLLELNEDWPWWRHGDIEFRFPELVRTNGGVPAEWLDQAAPEGLD